MFVTDAVANIWTGIEQGCGDPTGRYRLMSGKNPAAALTLGAWSGSASSTSPLFTEWPIALTGNKKPISYALIIEPTFMLVGPLSVPIGRPLDQSHST